MGCMCFRALHQPVQLDFTELNASNKDDKEICIRDTDEENEDRITPKMTQMLHMKQNHFYERLELQEYGQSFFPILICVQRNCLIESAFQRIMKYRAATLQHCPLQVVWLDEDSVDQGGPSREFFYELSRKVFDPDEKLFQYSSADRRTVQFAPFAPDNRTNALKWYRFCGRILGLALMYHYQLKLHLPRSYYKALLHLPYTLYDLKSLDREMYRSLLWIRDHSIDEHDMAMYFCASYTDPGGGEVIVDLIPYGRDQPVTDANKDFFIQTYLKWRLDTSVADQTASFVYGFEEIINPELVQTVFNSVELMMLLCGTVTIDVTDWKDHTEFVGYDMSHVVVCKFWSFVEKLTNEQRLKLLKFVTGSASLPYNGFAGLRNESGLGAFTIANEGTEDMLPSANTCYNKLNLPPYSTQAMLEWKLLMAIEETDTFGFA